MAEVNITNVSSITIEKEKGGQDDDSKASSHSSLSNSGCNGDKKLRKNFFPRKLMDMLSSPGFADCVTWKCDGTAFFISDPEKFAKKMSDTNPEKSVTRKESFTRKLNRWGFKMELTKGPNCGNYSHPLFCKDKPWLCETMVCEKSTNNRKTDERSHKKRKIFDSQQSDSLEGSIFSPKRMHINNFDPYPGLEDYVISQPRQYPMINRQPLNLMYQGHQASPISTLGRDDSLKMIELMIQEKLRSRRMRSLLYSDVNGEYCPSTYGHYNRIQSDSLHSNFHKSIIDNAMRALVNEKMSLRSL